MTPAARPTTEGEGTGVTGGLLIGVDVGSSSTKGVLVDTGGHVLREASRAHSISHPRAGRAEQDPELLDVSLKGFGSSVVGFEAVSYTHLTLPTKRIV